ncbi:MULTISPECIES: acyl-CoA dehydrogenase family protein [unclassified Rhodococcus (in: high G+C Gram-positive bacteria)]|uniref:acyl-CoA dehydrogenase family protein n=1 Tax=unclassified Rhodococcus (in: high G+C Gram-positive bacteria) TaxID=192944 RepID=UPI00163A3AC6|nr:MULTISPECIES: acyl-CoA dehydrogenase family protein [unclassified Rhodococcus (in: high G+C Gram-positive bacteria)]MBC2640390.1 acyl-CoA dehydrogenase family protein [Rhodococcus sp. 3A]MBC2894864.1 acyl-CoA dehydrogenase family protein [Rhodococcus sp. 4CII]
MNFVRTDPALRIVVDRWTDAADRNRLNALLDRLGADAAGRLDALAATADKNPPVLQQFDRDGERIDRIAYHPAYRELCRAAYSEYGLSALSHRGGLHGWEAVPPHLVKYLASYVFVQAEFGLACPVSMTDAAARILRMFGDPGVFGSWIDGLTSTDPRQAMTGAMFMTEPQAGTDIARTETVAERDGDGWRLTGKKWFASNPDADVIITLARFPGGDDHSTRGVGMFMVPKVLASGQRNSYTIDRLKDKLGTRSMPSGEVSLTGAHALQVGELDRGFRQMAEMVNTSRLSNAMRSSALMRRAVRDAVDHTRQRVVFGKKLFDQPLMRATLLPLALDAEAALALVAYSAQCLQAADTGDDAARGLIRVLTPLAKHYVCKRARVVTGEAMEVRGGNGYIEEWAHARLVRDAHLGSIWEGSSNVIALDVLRCMRKSGAHRQLADAMRGILAGLGPDCAAGADVLRRRWDDLIEEGDLLLAGDDDTAQAGCARYANELARTVMATLLFDLADFAITSDRGYRSLLVANAYLAGGTGHVPAAALHELAAVVDGTDVEARAAHDTAPRTVSATGVLL